MAVSLAAGFKINVNEPIDTRLVLTKEQMKTMQAGGMPPHYFALCSDDNCVYVYDSTNEVSSETGKFKILTASVMVDNKTIKYNDDNELEVIEQPAKDSSEKIWNCTDSAEDGELSKFANGQIVIDNVEKSFKYIEIYYSSVGSTEIQYFKMITDVLLSGGTGTFYTLILNKEPLSYMENASLAVVKNADNTYKITITSARGENSEIKIYSVWGGI